MKNKKLSCIFASLVILLFSSISLAAVPVDVTAGKEVVITLPKTLEKAGLRVSIADCSVADIRSVCGYTSYPFKEENYGCIQVMKQKCDEESGSKKSSTSLNVEGAKGEKTESGELKRGRKSIAFMHEIILNGKKPGVTSLIVWDAEGKTFFDVVVVERKATDIERAFENRLEGLRADIRRTAPNDEINVSLATDTIVLSGYAANQQTIDKIVQLANAYAIASEVTTTKNYSAGLTTETINTTGKVLNYITIKDAQQVVLEVKVAQINKTKLKELGISYFVKNKNFELTAPGLSTSVTGSVGGATAAPETGASAKLEPGLQGFSMNNLSPQIGVAHFPSGIAAILKALQEKGFGKILAEPNLAVRSGERGNFHVGQRIPIQTVTGVGTGASVGITYEEVGIRINFAPQVLETGAIRLKIDPAEVSSVARFITFQGIVAPEIDTRTVNTSVDLRDGESLVLAGLLSEEMTKNIQKVPLLGDIPILGALFRSSRDDLTQTEVVFFITPKLVKPIPRGVKTPLPTDKALTPEEEREFQWIPFPGSSSGPEGKNESGSQSK